ncbi:MAG: benzoate transporter [Eubacteriaceae bacterium]|nr:benzoate transporter [Eubacteriaceae bacterium]
MQAAKRKLIEKGPGFKSGWKDLGKNLNGKTISTGVISSIFGCTGPALVTIDAATNAVYTPQDIATWLFGIYVFGGLISIIMSLYYKQPISGAYSIPGAAMLAVNLMGYSFAQASGAFVLAGVIVLLLGLTGLIGKVMQWLPLPIVMGMICGAMIKFGIGVVTSTFVLNGEGTLQIAPFIIGIAAISGFFVLPKFIKKVPPVLGALILGFIAAFAMGIKFDFSRIQYIPPKIMVPEFTFGGFMGVSIPLAALVLGAENSQAIGVLYAQGYKPPINAMTIISGIGGIAAGLVGAHNANIAGPMTAICSSDQAGEDKNSRYAASVVCGLTFGGFGLVASFAAGIVSALPSGLVSILAGLAMFSVLIQSLELGFSTKKFKMGAFVALITSMSGISLLNIGASFWGLVFGVIISLIAESSDFKETNSSSPKDTKPAYV